MFDMIRAKCEKVTRVNPSLSVTFCRVSFQQQLYFTTEAQLVTGYGKYIPSFFEYWEAWRLDDTTSVSGRVLLDVCLVTHTICAYYSRPYKRWYWLKNFINEFCTVAILYMVGKKEVILWLKPLLQGFWKLKACLHVRRLKAQKSCVWTTCKPVCSKQNAFLRVVIPQGKNCDRTGVYSGMFNSTNFFSVGDILSQGLCCQYGRIAASNQAYHHSFPKIWA